MAAKKLSLYNTLTRKIEQIIPLGSSVNLYTCGPTVYDHAHIGNLRSYIFADVLRRTLELNGIKVRWVMNITDVDDKTIKKAIQKFGPKATVSNLRSTTDEYYEDFLKDLREINIPLKSIEFIRVSDRIPQIVSFIEKLLEKDYAYKTEDGVYFSIKKYQESIGNYGELVGENFLAGKKIGARVNVDEYAKEDLSDFALWKARSKEDGNIYWDGGILGLGRPGWHIECSAINYDAFKGSTDIHTGGVDLIFPHHTNEIAQSEPIYKPFVRHWAHCEHLMVNGRKMAKRDGNFYTLENLRKILPNNAGVAFRYLVLQTHYRSKLNFTLESLQGAYSRILRLNIALAPYKQSSSSLNKDVYRAKLKDILSDDLDTPGALALISEIHSNPDFSNEKHGLLEKLSKDLGIYPTSHFLSVGVGPVNLYTLPPEVLKMITDRDKARDGGDYAQSDALRKKLENLGYRIEDSPEGTQVFRKL